LRAQDTNTLCLECHGPDRDPKKLDAEHVLTIFNGSVQLPEDYFKKNKVVVLPIKFGMGHPIEGHPVSNLMDPAHPGTVKTPMNCLTCHQPHSSLQPDLLVKDQANNMAFCSTCHKDLNKR
jgi:predicted CXXCH cytochrome family protein